MKTRTGPTPIRRTGPARRAPYQSLLRALGTYLDAFGATSICLIELPDGFAVRYQPPGDTLGIEARHFSFDVLHARDRLMRRNRGETDAEETSNGYAALLRALGRDLDVAEAHTLTIDEVEDLLVVSYVAIATPSASPSQKRLLLVGPDERARMLQRARGNRRSPTAVRQVEDEIRLIG
ncbi:MAG TPA: hypothetical protein VFB58_02545 [Chloroflexota bacterium]|nr:hypothetical protein [Chloroflexota bacterium]